MLHFTKMHGCGNDYIYVDTTRYPIADPASAARRWSDRHTGIGSDGLVLIGQSAVGFTMRIFNADGSEAMMCGNACRCIGKYLYEKRLTTDTEIPLHTASGVKVLELDVHEGKVAAVTVDMGEPVFENRVQYKPQILEQREQKSLLILPSRDKIRQSQGGGLPDGLFVSMGNPHYVVFTDDVDSVETLGGKLECHTAFPERCNIEFADVRPDGIRVRVWERGSGITMACGTGACAVCVAAARTGRAGRQSRIIMDGGALGVEWSERDNHVRLTGPAEFAFEGEVEI